MGEGTDVGSDVTVVESELGDFVVDRTRGTEMRTKGFQEGDLPPFLLEIFSN